MEGRRAAGKAAIKGRDRSGKPGKLSELACEPLQWKGGKPGRCRAIQVGKTQADSAGAINGFVVLLFGGLPFSVARLRGFNAVMRIPVNQRALASQYHRPSQQQRVEKGEAGFHRA